MLPGGLLNHKPFARRCLLPAWGKHRRGSHHQLVPLLGVPEVTTSWSSNQGLPKVATCWSVNWGLPLAWESGSDCWAPRGRAWPALPMGSLLLGELLSVTSGGRHVGAWGPPDSAGHPCSTVTGQSFTPGCGSQIPASLSQPPNVGGRPAWRSLPHSTPSHLGFERRGS